jgi:hypothetical protein
VLKSNHYIQEQKSYDNLKFDVGLWAVNFGGPISSEDEGHGNLKCGFWQFFVNVKGSDQ